MQRSTRWKKDLALTWMQTETLARNLEDDCSLGVQINGLCTALFDRWRERRELIALAYLLHAWPFFPSTRPPFRRLSATLKELLTFHSDVLDEPERECIANIHHLTDC